MDRCLVRLGPASSFFIVAFSVYAIIAHHLSDIRTIIRKTVVFSLLIAAVGGGYSLAEHTVTESLSRFLEKSQCAWLGNVLGVFLVAIFFAPLKIWLEKQVGRLLYRNEKQKDLVKN